MVRNRRNKRRNPATMTIDLSPCDMRYCQDCRPSELHEAAETAGITDVGIDTDLLAIKTAWDELDAVVGTQTRKPITEIMGLSGDYHYNYAWGSLVVDDFFQGRIRSIAHGASMTCEETNVDTLMIRHRLPNCGRHQRNDKARARARRESVPPGVIGWPRRDAQEEL